MTVKLWIIDDDKQLTMSLDKHTLLFHTTSSTQEALYCKNYRIAELSFEEKIEKIEQMIQKHAIKRKQIEVLTQYANVELTYAAIQYCLTYFPKQLALVHNLDKWSNPNILWDPKEHYYHHVHHLIERNQFASAEIFLHSKVKNPVIFHLLTFAKRLQQGEAKYTNPNNVLYYFELLEKVYVEQLEAPPMLDLYLRQMKRMIKGDQVAFLYYLQSYVSQLYKSNDLIDFIVMYYRLVEELLLYAMGWDATNENHYFVRKNVKNHIREVDSPSRHFQSYLRIVKKEASQKPNAYNQKLLQDFSQDWLVNMINLRHDGIGGHGFQFYTKQLFESVCEGNPLDKLEILLQDYDIQAPYSLFELIQTAIVGLIRYELYEIEKI